jgi:hypothetical protein
MQVREDRLQGLRKNYAAALCLSMLPAPGRASLVFKIIRVLILVY